MASKGDIVRCYCGAVLTLPNDRLPYHKRPGSGLTCPSSGAIAEGYDAVAPDPQAVLRAIIKNAVCPNPKCGAMGHVVSTPADDPRAATYPLMCAACRTVGMISSFLKAKMKTASLPAYHRYKG